MKKKPSVIMTFRASESEMKRINYLAKKLKITKSAVIRKALANLIV